MHPKDPFGLIGQVIDGHFRVDEVTGEGGFSVVYRGFHVGLGETIAIKCLKLPAAIGSAMVESFMRRFRDEGKLLYRLSQGNLHIVRSIASGITMGPITGALVPYMVLEWLEGISLAGDLEARQAAGKTGRTLQTTVELLDSALLAVGYAHTQGVVHRDLNPGNIFLTNRPDGVTAKVLDFGVAKVVSDHAMEMGPRAPTFGQIRIFAPGYAAPEQFDTALGPIGTYTDVYTLALVMMEVLTDSEVVRGDNLGEFVFQTLNADKRPTPHGLGIPVGDEVNAVFAKATSLHPAARQKDANELYSSLKEAMRSDARRPPPRPSRGAIDKFHSDDEPSPDTLREQRADNFKLTLAGTGEPLVISPAPPPAAGRPAAPVLRPNEYAVPIIDPRMLVAPPVEPPHAEFKSTLRMDSSALQNAAAPRFSEEIVAPRFSEEIVAPRPPQWQPPPVPITYPTTPPAAPAKTESKTWVLGVVGAGLLVVVLGVVGLVAVKVRGGRSKVTADPLPSAVVSAPARVESAAPIAAPIPAQIPAPIPGPVDPPPSAIPVPPPVVESAIPAAAAPPSAVVSPPVVSPPLASATPSAIKSATPFDPHAFNLAAAQSSLSVVDVILASCKKPGGTGGNGLARVTFVDDGTVKNASIDPPFDATPEGECAAARFRTAHVPPFQGPPVSVEHPFHIPK